MKQILKYSGLEYANTVDNFDQNYLKNGDKLLVIVFGRELSHSKISKQRWHYFRICRVVKDGPVMFKNRNNFWCINIDSVQWLDGKQNHRINNNSFLTYFNKINNEPLSINSDNFIYNDMIVYTVRIPNDDLLEEIRQYKKKESLTLFRLSFLAILNADLLKEYNYLITNYCIPNKKIISINEF